MTAERAKKDEPSTGPRRAAPVRALVWCVRLYQKWISPLSPPRCRFYPSCSSYAVTAIERHGALRGTMLAARRLSRCHPWNPGGIDDVPEARRSPGTHG